MQTSLTYCINNYCKAVSSSRYQRDVILNSANEWITMGSNQSEDTSQPSSSLTSFSISVVLSILWCFVFLLVFSICLFLLKIPKNKKQKSQLKTQGDEVSETMKKQEKNKSYKERVNSVYYEWFTDHSPQRNPGNSDCTVQFTL